MKLSLHHLSLREKIVLTFGSCLVLVAAVYFWVWSPLSSSVEEIKSQIASQQELYVWLSRAKQRLQQYSDVRPAAAQAVGNIMVATERSLAEVDLAKFLKQVWQPEENQVTIVLQNVAFDKLVTWLQQLTQQYQINIMQLQVKRTSDLGIVNAQVTLVKK